jgi:hypothetical protein
VRLPETGQEHEGVDEGAGDAQRWLYSNATTAMRCLASRRAPADPGKVVLFDVDLNERETATVPGDARRIGEMGVWVLWRFWLPT